MPVLVVGIARVEAPTSPRMKSDQGVRPPELREPVMLKEPRDWSAIRTSRSCPYRSMPPLKVWFPLIHVTSAFHEFVGYVTSIGSRVPRSCAQPPPPKLSCGAPGKNCPVKSMFFIPEATRWLVHPSAWKQFGPTIPSESKSTREYWKLVRNVGEKLRVQRATSWRLLIPIRLLSSVPGTVPTPGLNVSRRARK